MTEPATKPLTACDQYGYKIGMEAIHPIRALRESQQPPLSKRSVADTLGVTWNAVHRWEAGTRKPSRKLLPVIEQRLGIAPAEILAFEREAAE